MARDGSCMLGDAVVPRAAVGDPDALSMRVFVDDELRLASSTAEHVRSTARLIAEISEFITLRPGDVVLAGSAPDGPLVRAGARVRIEIEQAGQGRGDAARCHGGGSGGMKRGRVAHAGAIHEATPAGAGAVRLDDGRVVAEDAVVWLPPFEVGTVIALGLNYADHARELAFNAQDEPLVFLKGPGSLLGHRGVTRRPADATFMHYECELAVVIGKPARRVSRADAREHVAGYTIGNDYAVRDYLENWYRPNLRVKSRDGATVLGPWLVDADDVEWPPQRALHTFVNGRQVQSGHTRDLVFDIASLIEYLSGFMTLSPGDVILTGTPEGIVNVDVGDEVACEIDGLGRLLNRIAGDAEFGRALPAAARTTEEFP